MIFTLYCIMASAPHVKDIQNLKAYMTGKMVVMSALFFFFLVKTSKARGSILSKARLLTFSISIGQTKGHKHYFPVLGISI